MKTAVCYFSQHHGNTKKVLDAIAAERDVTLIDVTAQPDRSLADYDCIGFASGIYFGKFHEKVTAFAQAHLPADKPVFLLYTCGSPRKGYTRAIEAVLAAKGGRLCGTYACRGYDTYGPFRLIGGIAKQHPDAADLKKAVDFYDKLEEDHGL